MFSSVGVVQGAVTVWFRVEGWSRFEGCWMLLGSSPGVLIDSFERESVRFLGWGMVCVGGGRRAVGW